ncbi:MAG TPA: hypothetical protein VJU84_21505 [Pyrinomonadaceae bacterium]|nr:hypothetical protein [Pyrinomonadaceae bacterium]
MSQELYKLKVIKLASGEIGIIGNRAALKDLADVCRGPQRVVRMRKLEWRQIITTLQTT